MNSPAAFRRLLPWLAAVCLAAVGASNAAAGPQTAAARAPRTVDDFRYFRALTLDLEGRLPTRAEIAAYERPDFDVGTWLETELRGPGYVDRLTRIYMDALRLEASPLVQFTPAPATIYAETIKDEGGKLVRVWYRRGQRRANDATDGDFCLAASDSGIDVNKPRPASDALPRVKKEVLDKATVLVRPWWMYRDYRAAKPRERIGESWTPPRGFQPVDDLLKEPDGKTDAIEVRVCREEAQTAERGTLWASTRPWNKVTPPPPGRTTPLPIDDVVARAHKGEAIACATQLGLVASIDCGCGPGLERCMPEVRDYALSFVTPTRELVGLEGALPSGANQIAIYQHHWWSEEARRFLGYVFAQDRDVREIVTGRYTYVNGPLAQFYKWTEPSACCSHERAIGMQIESEPLFNPEKVPGLLAHETDLWTFVPDRGAHAAGILTTAAFLEKFASRRARAAAAYQGLLCKNFVADTSSAPPSTDPNLTKRPGCSSCHVSLEPLAAYFTKVKEGSMTYLSLHTVDAQCRLRDGKPYGYCPDFYDRDFSDDTVGVLRGAYGSHEHADAGPEALGAALAASPDYVRCAVEQVTSSLLGRALGPDDEELRARLQSRFVESGHRMRALVRGVLMDPAYAKARLGPSGEGAR